MKLTLQVGPTPPVGVDKPDGSFANTRRPPPLIPIQSQFPPLTPSRRIYPYVCKNVMARVFPFAGGVNLNHRLEGGDGLSSDENLTQQGLGYWKPGLRPPGIVLLLQPGEALLRFLSPGPGRVQFEVAAPIANGVLVPEHAFI